MAIAAVRRAHHNQPSADDLVLQANDVLLAIATDPAVLREATSLCGELQPGHMASHREDLDYMRVFASSRLVVGHTLRDIRFPEGMVCSIAHVRRGDADLMPSDDLILEFGDRVVLLVNRAHMKPIHVLFGDSIKGTAELSFISIGIGAALGLLVGLIPVPIPGLGTLALGLAALLLVALVLGRVRRLGPLLAQRGRRARGGPADGGQPQDPPSLQPHAGLQFLA